MKTTLIVQKGLKPRVDVFTKKLHQNMSRLWTDATKAFLEEIIKNDLIKVDTGMSRASLLPLARAVRMLTVVRASINPKRGPRPGYNAGAQGGATSWEVGDPSQPKSIEAGIKAGQKAYRLNFGTPGRPVFRFEFNIVVYQHWLHEVYNNDPSWKSLERGTDAFRAYIKENAPNYVPTLAEWLLPE